MGHAVLHRWSLGRVRAPRTRAHHTPSGLRTRPRGIGGARDTPRTAPPAAPMPRPVVRPPTHAPPVAASQVDVIPNRWGVEIEMGMPAATAIGAERRLARRPHLRRLHLHRRARRPRRRPRSTTSPPSSRDYFATAVALLPRAGRLAQLRAIPSLHRTCRQRTDCGVESRRGTFSNSRRRFCAIAVPRSDPFLPSALAAGT